MQLLGEHAIDTLKEFAGKNNCSLLVLIGLKELDDGHFRRDIGLVPIRNSDFTQKLINAVSTDNREYLQLEEKCTDHLSSSHGQLFEQKNLTATRKQILPIIQKFLDF